MRLYSNQGVSSPGGSTSCAKACQLSTGTVLALAPDSVPGYACSMLAPIREGTRRACLEECQRLRCERRQVPQPAGQSLRHKQTV